MADSLQIRGGSKAGMPQLQVREPAYVKDEKALYIGTDGGNVKLCAAGDPARISALEAKTAGHDTSISDLQAAVGTQTTAITNLQTAVAGNTTDIASLEAAVEGKLTATQAAAQAELTADAALADVVTAYNSLLAALRAAGILAT